MRCATNIQKHYWPNPRETGIISGSFLKELRKSPKSKTEIPEICLQFSESKFSGLFDEFQKLTKDAFGIAAHAIIEQLKNAEMPPHLKKSINQARLENGTYEQIVTRLETELELNGLEAADEPQINAVS